MSCESGSATLQEFRCAGYAGALPESADTTTAGILAAGCKLGAAGSACACSGLGQPVRREYTPFLSSSVSQLYAECLENLTESPSRWSQCLFAKAMVYH